MSRLIVFEGGEGSGKSTQAALLAARIGALLTREPGGTALGARIRSVVLDVGLGGAVDVDPRAEALLMAADRAQHVAEVVRPALARGDDVVSDRFVGSTLAYQGYARGLDVAELARVSAWATGGIEPDVVLLLDMPLSVAAARMGRALDRMEAAGDEFHRRVAAGYRSLAAADPDRWVVVDGAGTIDEVAARVWAAYDAFVAVARPVTGAVFDDVVGQESAVANLRAAVAAPVHAYLLVGPPGSGKRTSAQSFAAALLCPTGGCGVCDVCRRALAGTHPDVILVERSGASISVDQAREVRRLAMRSPNEGARKVLILTDFHLVREAAPVLLKVLEEPPASTVFVILAEQLPPELVTIASRCVQVDFGPLPSDQVAAALVGEGVAPDVAAAVAAVAAGRLDRARLLANDPGFAARREAWRGVPGRLDGTGAAVAIVATDLAELLGAAGVAALEAQQAVERAELEERVERTGERGSGRKVLADRHKRELRRLRHDELRFGLATLAGLYGEALAARSGDARSCVDAVAAIQSAAEAMVRNPTEALLLQDLLLKLPPLVFEGPGDRRAILNSPPG